MLRWCVGLLGYVGWLVGTFDWFVHWAVCIVDVLLRWCVGLVGWLVLRWCVASVEVSSFPLMPTNQSTQHLALALALTLNIT